MITPKLNTIALLVICVLFLISCDVYTIRMGRLPVKPYVIVDKHHCDVIICKYVLQDRNGDLFEFEDRLEKYNLGDTIK